MDLSHGILAVLVGVVCLAPHGAPPPVSTEPQAVHLSIDQDGGLSPDLVAASVEQVRQIWSAAGVPVTWGRYRDEAPAGATRISIRVVGASRRNPNGARVLGWVTLSSTGRAEPMLFVSLPGVRDVLSEARISGGPLNQRPQVLRDRLMAQAIGRVTAHELGHYLLRTDHDEKGLLRASYSPADLTGPSLDAFAIPPDARAIAREELSRPGRLQAARTQ